MGVRHTVGRRAGPADQRDGAGADLGVRARGAAPRDRAGSARCQRAVEGAEKQLKEQHGDVDRAVHEVIEFHVRLAGAQGFLTNLGGLVTAAVTIPTNITGLALIQCRMVAGIAHLRGYDLARPPGPQRDPACHPRRGRRSTQLVRKKKLPGAADGAGDRPAHDPHLDPIISVEVASDLITQVAGKRLATTVGRRVPVVGGVVGAGADGYATWQIGRYADRELLPRAPPVEPASQARPTPLLVRRRGRARAGAVTSGRR